MRTLFLTLTLMLLSHVSFSQNTVFYGEYARKNPDQTVNMLSPVRNQNQPKVCGASWAFALASAMSDQFNKIQYVSFPEVVLSPQMLVTCVANSSIQTCDYPSKPETADLEEAMKLLEKDGVSDETCNNWYANTIDKCTKKRKCMDCANEEDIHHEANCSPRDYHEYRLKNSKRVSTENQKLEDLETTRSQMIADLNQFGPLVCNMSHSEGLFMYRIGEINLYQDEAKIEYHSWVSVVGYIDSPKNTKSLAEVEKLWVVRLSYGDNVGRFGYIYLNADATSNPLGLLDNCYSLEVNEEVKIIPNTEDSADYTKLFKPMTNQSFNITKPRFGFSTATFSPQMTADSGIDAENDYQPINWGNHDNRNYLTWIKNQHIPTYCGSCWAQGATSVLNDRVNIKNIREEKKPFPRHVLSVQSILACGLGGTCLGGDATMLWQRAKNWKIPTNSCREYEAKNPEKFSCEGKARCYNASKKGEWEITQFNGMNVQGWTRLRGEQEIKHALLTGPVACDFEVTDKFENYKPDMKNLDKKDIYNEDKDIFQKNHIVSIVGWDKDAEDPSIEYWIVRNSWGTQFGYYGLFYIKTGNVLGIESGCFAPTEILVRNWDE